MHARDRGFGRIVALTVCLYVSRASAQLGWYEAKLPTHRSSASMVFDGAANRMLMFGGLSNAALMGATATWSGGELLLLPVAVEPSPRSSPLAYDVGRRTVVLFGGSGPPEGLGRHGDTWLLENGAWRSVPTSPNPGPRSGHALAHDAARGRTVLFGGGSLTAVYDDTWEWDGQVWTKRNVAVHPGAGGHTMEYSPLARRILYFGGATGFETWEWDGTAWTALPSTAVPTTPGGIAMVWDEARAQMLLVQDGPYPGYGVLLWRWTGTAWVAVPTAHTPGPRFAYSVAYDRGLGGLRLFGGINASREVSDTWLWDGNDWSRIGGGVHPEPMAAALSHDTQRDRVVVLSAQSAFSSPNAPTWEWDGRRWTDVSPAVGPSARGASAMAYDSARKKHVLFGGVSGTTVLGDTWSWDGSAWTRLQPARAPSARRDHAVAFDFARQRLLLFGGMDASGARLADTWEWDGTTWTQLQPAAAPSARSSHGMAYDLWRARTVLFGGSVGTNLSSDETWEWDGTTWTKRTPPAAPPARSGHAMAFDFLRGRTVLAGSQYGNSPGFETYEWDGSAWVQTTGPLLGSSPRMAFSAAARACVAIASGWPEQPKTRLYGDLSRAQTLAYDQPCAGSRGPLALTPLSWPRWGEPSFALDAWNAPPYQAGALLLASYPVRLALPGSCLLLVDPSTTFAQVAGLSSGSGFASFALPIPPNPALRGATLFTQGVVLDPAMTVLPLVTSNGMALRVGDV